jgi:hypothetical protein
LHELISAAHENANGGNGNGGNEYAGVGDQAPPFRPGRPRTPAQDAALAARSSARLRNTQDFLRRFPYAAGVSFNGAGSR